MILFFERLRRFLVVDVLIVVRVVAAHGGHGDDLAGVDIHHDAERAVQDAVFVDGVLEVLFQIGLYRRVDGQHEAVAIGRVVVFFIGIEHLGAVVALAGDDLARRTLQERIIIRLEALLADVVSAHKAEHLCRQRRIGIIALRVRLEIDALDLVLVDKLAHLIGQLLGDLPSDDLITVGRVGRLLVDEARLHVQDLGQAAGDMVEQVAVGRVLHLGCDLVRVDEHGLDRGRCGKHIHVTVIDHAARSREVRIAGLIVDGKFFILVMLHDHQAVERENQRNEQHNAAQDHQKQRPPQHGTVRPLRLFGGADGFFPLRRE